MEKALLKLAKQLNVYDEASLMALWDKYQAIVQDFQPSRKWEESALVFCLIQAVHFKNQLFNAHWADQQNPGENGTQNEDPLPVSGPVNGNDLKERGKVLRLRPREDDESV